MKIRRHHNNKGLRQIRRGKTRVQVERMARRVMREQAEGRRLKAEGGHGQPATDNGQN